MSAPTQPLDQEPVSLIRYEQRVKATLVYGLLIGFVSIIMVWTFKPPQLPGDIAGAVVGGFIGWIGGLLTGWGVTSKTGH